MRNKAMLITLLGLALGGCNMVIADQPWFDQPGTVQQKPGLWVMLETADCPVDATTKLADMPACANPLLVTDAAYSGRPDDGSLSPEDRNDPARWNQITHVLVDGTPMVDQLRVDVANPDGSAPLPLFNGKLAYIYLAVEPIALDPDGRIIAARRWPVMCGPLQRGDEDAGGGPRLLAAKPYPGMTAVHGMACHAGDVTTLREAAVKSEVSAPAAGYVIMESRWLRDAP